MQWQPATQRQWRRLGIVAAALAVLGTVALLGAAGTANADVQLQTDSLDVAGVNKTVSGNVTDATLSTTLNYQTDVPDSDRRIIRLKAGPSTDNLETIDYTQREVSDSTSGTVTLSGSLTDHPDISADALNPQRAGETTTDLVVQAEIEVTRSDGSDPVTHTVTDDVTLQLTDDGQLVAEVGGTGEVVVETDA